MRYGSPDFDRHFAAALDRYLTTPPENEHCGCAWCPEGIAGEHTATAAHVAVAMPGALVEGAPLCDDCHAAFSADLASAAVA